MPRLKLSWGPQPPISRCPRYLVPQLLVQPPVVVIPDQDVQGEGAARAAHGDAHLGSGETLPSPPRSLSRRPPIAQALAPPASPPSCRPPAQVWGERGAAAPYEPLTPLQGALHAKPPSWGSPAPGHPPQAHPAEGPCAPRGVLCSPHPCAAPAPEPAHRLTLRGPPAPLTPLLRVSPAPGPPSWFCRAAAGTHHSAAGARGGGGGAPSAPLSSAATGEPTERGSCCSPPTLPPPREGRWSVPPTSCPIARRTKGRQRGAGQDAALSSGCSSPHTSTGRWFHPLALPRSGKGAPSLPLPC